MLALGTVIGCSTPNYNQIAFDNGYASLRDLASYGASLGFDDAERIMENHSSDSDKRALMLAGNRRGTFVTLKGQSSGSKKDRLIHAYCPKIFTATKLSDEILASRSITIPQVRSTDPTKANRDPSDHKAWPINRRQLVDDLWLASLTHLTRVRAFDRLVADRVSLTGRDLEPWRAILAVALWLQTEHGADGLFDRMHALALRYLEERVEVETASPIRIAIQALRQMLMNTGTSVIEFTPTALAEAMNTLAEASVIDRTGPTFTNAQRVGNLLRSHRLDRGHRTEDGNPNCRRNPKKTPR